MAEPSSQEDASPPGPKATPATSRWAKVWRQLKRFRRPVAAIAAFGAILSGLLGYWSAYQVVEKVAVPKQSPSIVAANASARGLSLAILPFSARTNEPAEAQLAEALSTDLTSSITRGMPFASVVSSSVAGSYKHKAIDARAVGRELNVRYLMEGDVRASGERLDVRVWLTEASTGTEVWSDSLDVSNAAAADTNVRQSFITRLMNQVKAALIDSEERRVLALPVSALNADELTLRADAIWVREPEPSQKVLEEARSLYDRALQLNPTLTSALMGQANILAELLDRDPGTDRDRLLREYDQMSLRLIAAAGGEARAWNIRADALQRQWRWEAALEANARAQKLDPTRFGTMGQRADILTDTGRAEEALAAIDGAFALQPPVIFAGWLSLNRCRAELALGRYDDAIDACEKAASTGDLFYRRLSVHMFLAAAYALKGNDGRAQSEKVKLLAQWPTASIAQFKARPISDVPLYLQQTEAHLYAGLRKVGIPEQ
jgi:adenylate cyclase